MVEKKIKKNIEKEYKELIDNMLSGFVIYEPYKNGEDFIFIEFNKAAEKIDGVKREDLIGRKVTEVFPGVKEMGLYGLFERVYKTGKAEHFPVTLYKDKEVQGWRENYAYKLSNGNIVAVYTDETKTKKIEEKLKKYSSQAKKAIEEIIPVLQSVAIGDLSKRVKVSKKEDNFTDLKVAINLTVDDLEVFKKENEFNSLALKAANKDLEKKIKERMQAIKESEERYRILFEESQDAIMVLEPPKWKFTSGNAAAIKLYGVKDEKELISLGPWDVSPDKQPDGTPSADAARASIGKALKEGSLYFEWMHKKYKGKSFPATILLTKIKIGEKSVVQATVRDITKQKQIESELRESEAKHRNLTQNIPGMVYRAKKDWSTEIISNSEQICGYSQEDFDSNKVNWMGLIHPDDKEKISKEGAELSKKQQFITQIYRIIDKSKNIRWIEDYKTSIFKDDKFIGIDGIVIDITERKKAEEKLKEKLEELEKINRLMVGRELKMVSLKEEVEKLKNEKKE